MDYRKIVFGLADAQTERLEYPDLLKRAYYDEEGVVEKAVNTNVFLFLGYKGSGKSALSEHLRLSQSEDTVIDQISLADFPYKKLTKIVSGDAENEVKSNQAWRWLLTARIFLNLVKDEQAISSNQEEVNKALSILSKQGLLPVTSFHNLVNKSASNVFKASFKNLSYSHTSVEADADTAVLDATDAIIALIKSYKEGQPQMIIIDGLDDILTSRDIQNISIAALLNQAKSLNVLLRDAGMPIKILILCRTDLFERIQDPNKNKIRQDASYSFLWYKEGVVNPFDCDLVKLANMRARIVYPEMQDLFKEFFPPRYENNDIYSAILEVTRHTPRDFLQLLTFIKKQCHSDHVMVKDIEAGINEYSVEYFLPEIRDELSGYFSSNTIDNIFSALSSLRKRDFLMTDLIQVSDSYIGLVDDIIPILKTLYDCSAVGHIYHHGDETRITFKYRNRNSSFQRQDRIILHKGLWKALNA